MVVVVVVVVAVVVVVVIVVVVAVDQLPFMGTIWALIAPFYKPYTAKIGVQVKYE